MLLRFLNHQPLPIAAQSSKRAERMAPAQQRKNCCHTKRQRCCRLEPSGLSICGRQCSAEYLIATETFGCGIQHCTGCDAFVQDECLSLFHILGLDAGWRWDEASVGYLQDRSLGDVRPARKFRGVGESHEEDEKSGEKEEPLPEILLRCLMNPR